MSLLKNDMVKLILIVAFAFVLIYLINNSNKYQRPVKNDGDVVIDLNDENKFQTVELDLNSLSDHTEENGLKPGDAISLTGTGFDGLSHEQLKHACFPIDKELTSEDLLPNNEFAEWSDMHPNGSGILEGKNEFLTAGHHIGINTVSQSSRNSNYGLRSDPANPQLQVSPWQQTTIGPDMTRRPLEIGNCS